MISIYVHLFHINAKIYIRLLLYIHLLIFAQFLSVGIFIHHLHPVHRLKSHHRLDYHQFFSLLYGFWQLVSLWHAHKNVQNDELPHNHSVHSGKVHLKHIGNWSVQEHRQVPSGTSDGSVAGTSILEDSSLHHPNCVSSNDGGASKSVDFEGWDLEINTLGSPTHILLKCFNTALVLKWPASSTFF